MNEPGQAVVAASAMPALLSREHAILEFNCEPCRRSVRFSWSTALE